MAVKKLPTKVSLALEVLKGTDSNGNPTYTKKSFSGVRSDAEPADVLEVGNAIAAVLKDGAEDCYLCETSLLANEE